jgi:hypothetical protein
VQFNDGGAFGGNAQFTYDKVLNTVTAGTFAGTLNGTGQNFKVGDDAWIGDINTADTIGLKGQQNAANCYIVFGNSDATGKLGRAGTGPLTYAGAFSATGNVTGGNILTGGIISATGNISGGNVAAATALFSLGTVGASGNTSGGNLTTAGQVSATANITGGNILTGGLISATGNVTGGNLRTGGSISATGAVTGASVVGGVMTGSSLSVTGTINGTTLTGTSLTVSTGNITGGNLLLSGAIVDSAQLDIQTSASNANIALAPNGTGVVTVSTQLVATGNVTGGNLRTAGLISATGQITGSQFNGSGAGLTSIPNGALSNSSITVNGTAISLGSSGTVTANAATLTGTVLNATVVSSSLTSVGTLGSLSVTGNVQGGNLRTAGLISATGAITGAALTGTSLTVSTGNITGGNLILSGAIEDSAQLDIRTTASNANIVLTPNGTGNVNISSNVMPTANATANIGSAALSFNTVFAKATSAQYADLAEKYIADAEYSPGTGVVFGGSKEVTVTSTDADRAVAGVVSTNPSYIMNAGLEAEHVATVALTGRVPTRVTGSVRKGDLMVSAGNGQARAEADPQVGTVIGKALENHEGIEGVIEVVVGRF